MENNKKSNYYYRYDLMYKIPYARNIISIESIDDDQKSNIHTLKSEIELFTLSHDCYFIVDNSKEEILNIIKSGNYSDINIAKKYVRIFSLDQQINKLIKRKYIGCKTIQHNNVKNLNHFDNNSVSVTMNIYSEEILDISNIKELSYIKVFTNNFCRKIKFRSDQTVVIYNKLDKLSIIPNYMFPLHMIEVDMDTADNHEIINPIIFTHNDIYKEKMKYTFFTITPTSSTIECDFESSKRLIVYEYCGTFSPTFNFKSLELLVLNMGFNTIANGIKIISKIENPSKVLFDITKFYNCEFNILCTVDYDYLFTTYLINNGNVGNIYFNAFGIHLSEKELDYSFFIPYNNCNSIYYNVQYRLLNSFNKHLLIDQYCTDNNISIDCKTNNITSIELINLSIIDRKISINNANCTLKIENSDIEKLEIYNSTINCIINGGNKIIDKLHIVDSIFAVNTDNMFGNLIIENDEINSKYDITKNVINNVVSGGNLIFKNLYFDKLNVSNFSNAIFDRCFIGILTKGECNIMCQDINKVNIMIPEYKINQTVIYLQN